GRNLTDSRPDLSSQTVLNDGEYRDGGVGGCEGDRSATDRVRRDTTGMCSTENIQGGRSCRKDFWMTNYSEHYSGRNLTDSRPDLSSQTVLNDGEYRDGGVGGCEGG
ncbi:hypothetical protein WUBG_17792, partial [Wuchereria bancrofti]